MDTKLISQYRSHLMGFAIIWVMSYHYFGKGEPVNLWNIFFAVGHGGVDIFLFLSGFGLTYSCFRNSSKIDYISFIKKRFFRVVPTYYIIIIAFGLLLNHPLIEIGKELMIFGFFLPMFHISSYDWYIPSLLLLYLIFPFFYQLFNKNPKLSTLLAILIGILLTLLLVIVQKGTVILFFSRIPIFFIGIFFAHLTVKNLKISKKQSAILAALAIFAFILELSLTYSYNAVFLRKTALSHIPFILITPALCISLAFGFAKTQFTFIGNRFLKILSFLGSISLEVYLIHITFYRSFSTMPILLAVIITISSAYILSIIINRTINYNMSKS